MMALEVGMIAKIVLPNDPYDSPTHRAYSIDRNMIDASHILITLVVSTTYIRGKFADITDDTYRVNDKDFEFNWHAYDLRPTTLANKLRRIE